MNILMIGAHPDDCDFRCGGLARKYVKAGHTVRFLSMTDGSAGHQSMGRRELAVRRREESKKAGEVMGLQYDVWELPDGDLECSLENRHKLIRYIREFKPDAIFCHRTVDYHADHRNSALLVQDSSYMLTVPNCCEDVPAMRRMPVILFYFDTFTNPVFRADVVVDIDDEIEDKFRMIDCHESQVYEWLPYSDCEEMPPEDKTERFKWLVGKAPVPGFSVEQICTQCSGYSRRFASAAALYRERLIARYGEEKGSAIRYAEAFEVSEYGAAMDEAKCAQLFPF